VLQAVFDYVLSKECVPSREHLFNDLLSLMACHAAVRAGDRLTPEAITELLALRELARTRTTARTVVPRRFASAATIGNATSSVCESGAAAFRRTAPSHSP
jgi:hypothetical protein